MKISLTLPQFGESSTQALIVRWLKSEGDAVAEQEPIVEMETEKAVFSYESPFRGKLTKILVGESVPVTVGTEIAQFEVSEADGKKYQSLGVGKTMEKAGGGAPAPSAPSKPTAASNLSPLIRSLAKEHGVSLDQVSRMKGTGPGGRLTKEDFLAQAKSTASAAPVREGVKTIPLSPIRSRIAENMTLSKQKIPHAGVSVEADLSTIDAWRRKQTKAPSYLPFVMVAALLALKKFPIINSSFKETEGRRWIEQYDYVHLGIALATEQGLMVPVIRNANRLKFSDLVRETERLVEAGRAGKLTVEELTGATFTINNTGALGAIQSQQIIPPPQAAVLALNRVVKRPWVVGEKVEIRPIIRLDIAFDHRVIDGDVATNYLVEVARNLEGFREPV